MLRMTVGTGLWATTPPPLRRNALAVQSALNGRKDAGPEKMPWNSNDLATVCA